LVHAVVSDWRTAPLGEREQALCAFAAKLTSHQRESTAADLDVLRVHGFDDRAIHDAVQVISYFNYITRIADALNVDPEDSIPRWGNRCVERPSSSSDRSDPT
jgi:uncharacterized peroxidase-related enzyme